MPSRLLLCAVLGLLLGGCLGGGSDDGAQRDRPPEGGAAVGPAGRDPEPGAARVIRAWADTLRRGDVAGASRYFALPSRVANNTEPIELETRADVEFFNRTLPCGAKVIDTQASAHGFVIATFRLTERPGKGRCGAGTGGTARAAFLIRDGRITDWLRLPGDGDVPGDTTPA